jgi:hypothetical protein
MHRKDFHLAGIVVGVPIAALDDRIGMLASSLRRLDVVLVDGAVIDVDLDRVLVRGLWVLPGPKRGARKFLSP